jgi:hypothetical protein
MRYRSRCNHVLGVMLIATVVYPVAVMAHSLYTRLDPDSAVVGQGAQGQTMALPSEFPNIQILPSLTVEQSEMSIAINPADRSMLLVGANTFSAPVLIRDPRATLFRPHTSCLQPQA